MNKEFKNVYKKNSKLSQRHIEVLEALIRLDGDKNKVAEKLCITSNTLKSHINTIRFIIDPNPNEPHTLLKIVLKYLKMTGRL